MQRSQPVAAPSNKGADAHRSIIHRARRVEDMSVTGKMRIGELAARTGTSPRSLRHYEQQGLLSPARGDNGYRVYDASDAIRAGNIKDLLETGLTIADVQQYLEEGCLDQPLTTVSRCPAELETVAARLARLDELIDRLQRTRGRLAAHADTLEHAADSR